MSRLFPVTGRRALAPFGALREEMDRLFNEWLGAVETPSMPHLQAATFLPRLDVVETEKELMVVAELPGLDPQDVSVELSPNLLTLKGTKAALTEAKGEAFYRRERRFGAFQRDINLPWEIDPGEVRPNATFKNGVLTVAVPRPIGAPAMRRTVDIKVG
jgi:HSP20 family protein